jgi:hypothetical protein
MGAIKRRCEVRYTLPITTFLTRTCPCFKPCLKYTFWKVIKKNNATLCYLASVDLQWQAGPREELKQRRYLVWSLSGARLVLPVCTWVTRKFFIFCTFCTFWPGGRGGGGCIMAAFHVVPTSSGLPGLVLLSVPSSKGLTASAVLLVL